MLRMEHQADIQVAGEVFVRRLTGQHVEEIGGVAQIRVRSDGLEAGEFSPIFYRTGRLDLLESGTFWLSDTPCALT